MAQKPHPHKEIPSNEIIIQRLNIINKCKPTINSGYPVRKHLYSNQIQMYRLNIINKFKPTINGNIYIVTKFKCIDSILSTNSNPQSIGICCAYIKSGIIFQGTNYLYPSPQGYITFVSLLFSLIRPHKVVHIAIVVAFTPVEICLFVASSWLSLTTYYYFMTLSNNQ